MFMKHQKFENCMDWKNVFKMPFKKIGPVNEQMIAFFNQLG